MKRLSVVLLGMVIAFWFGHSTAERRAMAASTAPSCPKYECKNVHAMWPGGAATITAHFQPGTQTNTENAYFDIFTDSSLEKKPAPANGRLDYWNYPTCLPTCGKDSAQVPKWQAPQQVTKTGDGKIANLESLRNAVRNICPQNGGAAGPLSANQNNENTAVPPQ